VYISRLLETQSAEVTTSSHASAVYSLTVLSHIQLLKPWSSYSQNSPCIPLKL